jgi:hypothetical protein
VFQLAPVDDAGDRLRGDILGGEPVSEDPPGLVGRAFEQRGDVTLGDSFSPP